MEMNFTSGWYDSRDVKTRISERPSITYELSQDYQTARIQVSAHLRNWTKAQNMSLFSRIVSKNTGIAVASMWEMKNLELGSNAIELFLTLERPQLWQTWDREEAHLYQAEVEIWAEGRCVDAISETFSIRSFETYSTSNYHDK